jgi:hypothetical protein
MAVTEPHRLYLVRQLLMLEEVEAEVIQERPHLLGLAVLVELVVVVAQTQHRLGQEMPELQIQVAVVVEAVS